MRLEKVEWFEIPTQWPKVEGWVSAALDHGVGYLSEDIKRELMLRAMLLWLVTDGAELRGCVVTTLWSQPRVKVCQIVLCGGENIADWHHLIAEIETYAREHGCDQVREKGRRGWKKLAARHGYEELSVEYGKTLR